MKVPNAQRAHVPEGKIVDYLLSRTHPEGVSKAAFFMRFGFRGEEWRTLAEALKQHVVAHDVTVVHDSPFGLRYAVEGPLPTPTGREPMVRSVWMVLHGIAEPQFISAYPLAKRGNDPRT